MTDEERRISCTYYDQLVNPKGCANKYQCRYGKKIIVDCKAKCRIDGKIGTNDHAGRKS
jgi:hypothetical protein